tara:strand:- start:257 stop:427 length:171 start_codon:yes stop_codon:yes gene_type:complete
MEDETKELVTAYVLKHYAKMFGGTIKPIVKEFDNHFQISKMEDSSPLILGKGIINL